MFHWLSLVGVTRVGSRRSVLDGLGEHFEPQEAREQQLEAFGQRLRERERHDGRRPFSDYPRITGLLQSIHGD